MKTYKLHYSLMDALMASPDKPFPPKKRNHQVSKMRAALDAFRTAPEPTNDHWEAVADAVNMVEALQKLGNVSDKWGIEDRGALINDALAALVEASGRKPMRMSGSGLTACQYMIDDYEELLSQLPERVMISAHRIANKALLDIIHKRKPTISVSESIVGVL